MMVDQTADDMPQQNGKRRLIHPAQLTLILLPLCSVIWAKAIQTRNEAEHRRNQTEVGHLAHHFHKNRDGKLVYLAARYLKWSNGYAWTVWLPNDGRKYQLCVASDGEVADAPDHAVSLKSGSNIVELTKEALTECTAFCLVVDGLEAAVVQKPATWAQKGLRAETLHREDVYEPATLNETLLKYTPIKGQKTEYTGPAVWVRVVP